MRGKDAAFCASTFRMLMNGKFVYDWFDACVETDREYYMLLSTMERLAVFNEYMGIFSQHEYSFLRHQEPYASLSLNRNTMTYFVEKGNNIYDKTEEQIMIGEYRKRLVSFLKEALKIEEDS